jgi:hypothetical protein
VHEKEPSEIKGMAHGGVLAWWRLKEAVSPEWITARLEAFLFSQHSSESEVPHVAC